MWQVVWTQRIKEVKPIAAVLDATSRAASALFERTAGVFPSGAGGGAEAGACGACGADSDSGAKHLKGGEAGGVTGVGYGSPGRSSFGRQDRTRKAVGAPGAADAAAEASRSTSSTSVHIRQIGRSSLFPSSSTSEGSPASCSPLGLFAGAARVADAGLQAEEKAAPLLSNAHPI